MANETGRLEFSCYSLCVTLSFLLGAATRSLTNNNIGIGLVMREESFKEQQISKLLVSKQTKEPTKKTRKNILS